MIEVLGTLDPNRHSQMDIMGWHGIMPTIDRMHEPKKVAIPIRGGDAPMLEVGNVHPSGKGMNGKVYWAEEEMTTLTTNKGEGQKIAVRQATSKGYDLCRLGGVDTVNLTAPGSTTRRGRVGSGMANTLDTGCSQGIFVEVNEDLKVYAIWYEKYQCWIAIRRLTPLECFRLQAFTDEDYERAAFVNSDSQLYKQCGNSVTVSVIEAIGERIPKGE